MMATMMSPTTMGMPGMMQGGMTTPMMPSSQPGMVMVPRCTIKMEKCTGGMKIVCTCDDKMACSTLQNLCRSMAGTMCGVCCMMNGMMVSCCNLTMGMCKSEMTANGVTISCTSGDKDCAAMIQGCCDCCTTMMQSGCTCYVTMNGMPICCC